MSLRSRPPNPDPELLVVDDAEFIEQLRLLEKHSTDSDMRELCVERVCCYALAGLNFMRLQCLLPKLSVIICVARAQGGLLLYVFPIPSLFCILTPCAYTTCSSCAVSFATPPRATTPPLSLCWAAAASTSSCSSCAHRPVTICCTRACTSPAACSLGPARATSSRKPASSPPSST